NYQEPKDYLRLKEALAKLDPRNRIFYLAIPPDLYAPVIRQIAAAGLAGRGTENGRWTRIIIEKPFGSDLATAKALNREVHEVFDEEQVYRIDHYLGKETVQNILVFRFANSVFEPIWNRRYIDHVQITVAETLGIEGRGAYFDEAGALRDMVENHMLQVLCLTAMEAPLSLEGD